ncbi:MAG TPA: cell wall-binding protein, partial [Spirochaetia bacterium]|nr:cell wall-binding protein [Spirochaetia bacterium]
MKKIFFTLSVLLILFVQACTISTTKIEEINYYSVIYNSNNSNNSTAGTVPVDSNKYEEGKTVTILENTGILVRSGYTFKGWNTVADGSGTAYITGVTFTMGKSDVTLYAEWSL